MPISQTTLNKSAAPSPAVAKPLPDHAVVKETESAALQRLSHNARLASRDDLTALQRSAGNRAVAGLLRRVDNVARAAPLIQRRDENPYAQATAHQGWDTTAHHIIPYSKLEQALERLSPANKSEILRLAVPSVLTKSMLDNLKIAESAVANTPEAREALRTRLVNGDEADTVEIGGIKFGDIRSSFFLWQGGNQFQGPNTTIRPEPASDKDAIDFDGKFFTKLSAETFTTLTGHGEQLSSGQSGEATMATLKSILAITKDVTPNVFDSSQWTEVTSRTEVEDFAKSADLDRSHMLKYAFFKVAQDQTGEGKTYASVKSKGAGEFLYSTVADPIPAQIKGTWLYIPYMESQNDRYTPKTTSLTPLSEVLNSKNVVSAATDGVYELTVNDQIAISGKKFKITGFDEDVPFTKQVGNKISVVKQVFENRKMKTIERQQSLFNYCVATNMPTSTYLPKALYDKLKTPTQQ